MPSYEHLKVPVWRLGHDEVHVGHFVLGFADFLRCFGAHSFKTTKNRFCIVSYKIPTQISEKG